MVYKWHVCAYCTLTIFMNEYTKVLIIRENGWRHTILKKVIKHWKQTMREINGRCLLVPFRATVFSSPLAECVGNSHEALSLETRSPSWEPCYRTENAHLLKDKMHACLCALSTVHTSETSHSLNPVPQVCACECGIYQQMNRRQQELVS